ncbi:hypothetical protein L1049_022709 [Liquidambar formosana]|uniref:Uncharacterized protein n=1 Tax=Liquidambar formosana TaxID=63359 RepID=A0AAP0RDE0_LIQFO
MNIKEWNREIFGDVGVLKNPIDSKIKELDHLEDKGLFNESLRLERKDLKEEFEEFGRKGKTSVRRTSAQKLERSFEVQEIKEAVFNCCRDKAPGPDGFTMAVFQECCDVGLGEKCRKWISGCLSSTNFSVLVNGKPRLKINMNKCAIVGINCEGDKIQRLAGQLRCSVGEWPFIYLGLPLGGNPYSEVFWGSVVDRVRRRLEDWKRALMSKGGRLVLIQSVLSSIPTYYLSLFRILVKVARSLEKLMRDFLWEGSGEGKRDHLVRWEIVSRSMSYRGLAFGNIVERNIALIGKWLWRLMGGMLKQALECRPGVRENLLPRDWIGSWSSLPCQLGKGIEFGFGKTIGGVKRLFALHFLGVDKESSWVELWDKTHFLGSFWAKSSKHMLKVNRSISEAQKAHADGAEKSGIPIQAIVELMSKEVGGHQHLGFLDKDYQDYIHQKRKMAMEKGDAGAVLQYFEKMRLEN